MADLKNLLSWHEMWVNYKGWKGFAVDAWIPALVSVIMTYVAARYSDNLYQSVCELAETTVMVLVTLSAFYLAAYTLVVSFLLNNHLPKLMRKPAGEALAKGLNATFAVSLMFASGGLIISLLIQALVQLNIDAQTVLDDLPCFEVSAETLTDWSNYIAYGVLLFLTLLPVRITFFNIRDVYSLGMLSMVDDIK